jgi:hypothetical protein
MCRAISERLRYGDQRGTTCSLLFSRNIPVTARDIGTYSTASGAFSSLGGPMIV